MSSFLTQPCRRRCGSRYDKQGQPDAAKWLSQCSDPKYATKKKESVRKSKRDALEAKRYFQERERGTIVRRVESKVAGMLGLERGEMRASLEAVRCSLPLLLEPFEIHEQGSYSRREAKKVLVSCQRADDEMQRVAKRLELWVDKHIVTETSLEEYSNVIEGHLNGMKVLTGLTSLMDELCPRWGLLRLAQMSLTIIKESIFIEVPEEGLEAAIGATVPPLTTMEMLEQTEQLEPHVARLEKSRPPFAFHLPVVIFATDTCVNTRGLSSHDQYTTHGWKSLQASYPAMKSESMSQAALEFSDRLGKRSISAWKSGPGKSKEWKKCRSLNSPKLVSQPRALQKRASGFDVPSHKLRPSRCKGKPRFYQHAITLDDEKLVQHDLLETLDEECYDSRRGIILGFQFRVGRILRLENHGIVYEVEDTRWPYSIHQAKEYRLRGALPNEYRSKVKDLKRRSSSSRADFLVTLDYEDTKWAIDRAYDRRQSAVSNRGRPKQMGRMGQRGTKDFEDAFPSLKQVKGEQAEVNPATRKYFLPYPPSTGLTVAARFNAFRRLKCSVSYQTVGWLIMKEPWDERSASFVTENVYESEHDDLPIFVQTWAQGPTSTDHVVRVETPGRVVVVGESDADADETMTSTTTREKDEDVPEEALQSNVDFESKAEKKRIKQQHARKRRKERERESNTEKKPQAVCSQSVDGRTCK